MFKMKKKNAFKAITLIAFIGLAYYLSRYGMLSTLLSKEGIRSFVESAGLLAPLAYILIYSIGICLFLPGTLLTAGGAVAFGTLWGFIFTLVGAMLGASGAFFIARFLGKDFVDNLLKEKIKGLKKYNDFMEKEGFSAIFYLRLIFAPFTPLNFAAGLTKVKFKDYFLGTLLGILPGTFIFTFFFDSVTNISSFNDLLSFEIILSVVLFVASFSIPIIVKKYKKVQQNN